MGGRGSGSGKSNGTELSAFDRETNYYNSMLERGLGRIEQRGNDLLDADEELIYRLADYDDAASSYSSEQSSENREWLDMAKEEYERAESFYKEARADYFYEIKDYDGFVDELNEHLGNKSTGYYKPSNERLRDLLDTQRGWKTYHRKHKWSK